MLIDIVWGTSDEHRQALRDTFAQIYVILGGAVLTGQGAIVYTPYTIFGANFLFAEVRPVRGEAPQQPVVKVSLHSTGDASPLAALLLPHILPVCSVVAPCHRGASPVSVRRQAFTTGC